MSAAGVPPTPSPSPTRGERGEGSSSGAQPERWVVPPGLKERVKRAARGFRREPTRSEEMLWRALRGQALYGRKFRRQQPVGRFVVDFYCSSERLVVEVDGEVHATQEALDRDRQAALESLGLRFVRLSAGEVESDLPSALEKIRAAFTERAVLPSPLRGGGARGGGAPRERNRAGT